MKLLVGLGNPGTKYEKTRHNAGFIVLDALMNKTKGEWSKNQFQGVLGRCEIFRNECLCLKPMTFMNLSGRSVREACRFYKIPLKDVVVLYDDLDVPSGKVKTKAAGGAGGHNGIRSIIQELGSDAFPRIKLGIGHAPQEWQGSSSKEEATLRWVLGQMSQEEHSRLENEMLDQTLDRIRGLFLQPSKT